MKNSTASNRKTGRMIAKNLIILVVLVFVAILAMWAWFTNKSSATADGISVECRAPDKLEIAIVPHSDDPNNAVEPADDDFTSAITLKDQDFMEGLKKGFSEVTSDGVTFMQPPLLQSNGVAKPDDRQESVWRTATPNEKYLSFDLYIRSKGEHDVYLDAGSKFTTVSPALTGDNATNTISNTKKISKDAIVGAARFSVYTNDNTKTNKLLWIPRPDILFSAPGIGSESLQVDVNKSDIDGDPTYKHYYWSSQKVRTEFTDKDVLATSESVNGEFVLKDKKKIARLSQTESYNNKVYYVTSVVCNMWLEGEDYESRKALVGGEFKVNLELTIKE